jgi:hypothetical protein
VPARLSGVTKEHGLISTAPAALDFWDLDGRLAARRGEKASSGIIASSAVVHVSLVRLRLVVQRRQLAAFGRNCPNRLRPPLKPPYSAFSPPLLAGAKQAVSSQLYLGA